jgi:hypothetical protein
MKCRLAIGVALVSTLASGCKHDPERPAAAAEAPPPAPAAPATPVAAKAPAAPATTTPVDLLTELAFVPSTAEAIVRVDLASLSARSQDAARTLDFVLRAQHPRIHALLSGAGITLGKEIRTVVLFAGERDAYAVAGVGDFDAAKLNTALRRTDPTVEPAAGGAVYTWKKVTPGAAESPAPGEDVAVGVGSGVVLAGTPALVRLALLTLAGKAPGIAAGPLAREVAAAPTAATAWGVAVPGPGAALSGAIPGLVRARFSSDIAAPGPDVDGLLDLRAEFTTAAEAAAFRGRLDAFLSTFAALAGKSTLGATFGRLRASAKLRVDGTTLVAKSSL